ncbi:tyrosine-type recombinase/integrase [Mycolicibacterium holsaticum]|uniref:tyrosine-type recombinase/integrase n=1 Tax=Mycolicibacterium holsaticum TaxID=152142 RepID=UPI001C7CF8F2|nr:site-specific integrase [Mycolicibacterium holsaticum]MDA4105709.1 integrase [Mycolicibacterium holsaticum DSM 44478 = JCM 12374]QZA13920.1 site-specific integrase [Mycolicibacterium holsaticum DSM 44478 = JCM 12374]UNC08620.1 site-specific integrase [Mycolicibacterium holsaticum DSM 44478 = JCM 12374]
MAYIRTHETTTRRNGKVVKRYEVVWSEPHRDASGAPIPRGRRSRQESYTTRKQAEARCDELNNAKHSIGGPGALADQRQAALRPFADYAAGWLAEQRRRNAEGTLRTGTLDNYERLMRADILPRFGDTAIGAITLVECEEFRADLAARLKPRSVANVWWPFAAVFRYAMRAKALQSSPADAIDRAPSGRRVTNTFKPHPLTGQQVAALAEKVGEISHPAYGLMVLFLCYTGLRRGELQGLTVADLTLTHAPDGTVTGSVRVERASIRRKGKLTTGETKTGVHRAVPLPSWLAARMTDYLATVHERANDPSAPLWPNRVQGGARRKGKHTAALLDWSEPVELRSFARRTLRDACEAVGIPVGTARKVDADGTVTPPTNGFRLHDTRHTFSVMLLTAGVNVLQVSKWLGHANKNMTLAVYADYMPEEAPVNPLAEPIAAPNANVVTLFGA